VFSSPRFYVTRSLALNELWGDSCLLNDLLHLFVGDVV
jgi:hypothetical protein